MMDGSSRIRIDSEPWTVGIVGAGILGLATARALEERGVDCEIFEPEAPGGGQSRGPVQAISFAGFDRHAAQLKAESFRAWRRWERELGIELFSQRGIILFGHEAEDLVDGFSETAPGPELIPVPESGLESFLPTAGSGTEAALLDRTGGAIWSQRTVGFLLKDLAGPVIPIRASAVEVLPDRRAAITAGEMRREYDAVVVCAGAGTKGLASALGVSIPIVEVARAYATFQLRPQLTGSRMAGFAGRPDGGEYVHGAPMRDNLRFRVVLDREVGSEDGSGSAEQEGIERLGHDLDEWVETVMPGLDPDGRQSGLAKLACLSWGNPHGMGIGIWRQGPALFPAGAPMFLSAPRLGQILADSAEGKPVPAQLRPEARFGLARSGNRERR